MRRDTQDVISQVLDSMWCHTFNTYIYRVEHWSWFRQSFRTYFGRIYINTQGVSIFGTYKQDVYKCIWNTIHHPYVVTCSLYVYCVELRSTPFTRFYFPTDTLNYYSPAPCHSVTPVRRGSPPISIINNSPLEVFLVPSVRGSILPEIRVTYIHIGLVKSNCFR